MRVLEPIDSVQGLLMASAFGGYLFILARTCLRCAATAVFCWVVACASTRFLVLELACALWLRTFAPSGAHAVWSPACYGESLLVGYYRCPKHHNTYSMCFCLFWVGGECVLPFSGEQLEHSCFG